MAAEYEVNIKINSQEIERELGKIDRTVAKIGKPKGGGSRRKPGIAGLLPSSEQLRAAEQGLVQLTAKTKAIQSIQDKFSERRTRALMRSNALNEKELRINKQLTAEARARLRLLSQAGAKGFDGTRPQGRQMAESINALTNAQEKRARLANKLNEMEAKGLNVQKLREKLGKATTEQSARRFASATKEFRLLEKTIRLEESKLRILKEQQKGFAFSPVRGTRTMMGSPAQIAAAGRQAVSPIGGKVDIAGSPAQIERIRKLEAASIRASKKTHFEELKLIQKRQKLQLDNNDKLLKDDRKRLADFDRDFAKSIADRQKMLQGVARAGIKPDSVFGPLRQLGQASMVAGANEAKLLAGRFRAPSSPLTARPVTRASAAQAAQQVEQLVRARAALEKRATDDAAAYKMRADKRVHRAQLALDQIEYKNKIDDIVELTNLQIKEGERAGRAFDKELKRRASVSSSGLTGQTSPIRGGIFQKGSPNQKRFEGVALGAGFPALFGGGAGSIIGGGLGGLTGSFGAQIALSAIGQQIDTFVAGMVDAGKALTSVGDAADFMAEKSLFSSDAMQFRIEKLIEEGKVTEAAALMTQEMAKKVGGTGLKALKDLGTEASKMGKLFNTLILQIQAFIAQGLTPLLKAINTVVGNLTLNNQFNALIEDATGDRAKEINEFLKPFTTKIRGQGGKNIRTRISQEGKRLAIEKFGGQVIPEGAAIEPTGLEVLRAADKPNAEAKKAAKLAERQQLEAFLALNKQMTAELDRQDEINAMNGKHIAEQLNNADQINASQEKRAGLLEAQLNGTVKEFELEQNILEIEQKGLLPADEARLIQAEKQIFAMEKQVELVNKQKKMFEQIGQTVKEGLVDGIMSALNGTKSLSESLSGVLQQLATMFMQVGISSLGQSLKIPGFANGGRPPVGRPSIVGERGPELFVPDRAGTIVPNNALGGSNIVVNVDASGSNVQGDGQQGKALGQAIGAAVQAEIIKQKMPGGLLS